MATKSQFIRFAGLIDLTHKSLRPQIANSVTGQDALPTCDLLGNRAVHRTWVCRSSCVISLDFERPLTVLTGGVYGHLGNIALHKAGVEPSTIMLGACAGMGASAVGRKWKVSTWQFATGTQVLRIHLRDDNISIIIRFFLSQSRDEAGPFEQ